MPHVLQNRKAPLLKPGQILAFKDHQIPVALDLPAECFQSCRPVCNDIVELCVERGDGGVREIGGQLIIVVDQDDRDDGACPQEFIADVEHLGHVGEVDRRKLYGRRVVLRFDIVAVDTVAASADDLVAGQLRPALAQPAGGKAGDHRLERLIAGRVGEACDGKEAGIAPDDLVFRQPDDRHRERGACMDRDPDRIRCRLHVAHQLTLASGKTDAADDKCDHRYKKRAARQIILPEQSRSGGEQQHERKVPGRIRIEQSSDRFFHTPPPPFQTIDFLSIIPDMIVKST